MRSDTYNHSSYARIPSFARQCAAFGWLVVAISFGLTLLAPAQVSAQQTASEHYRLGPGDRISVTVAGSPEFSTTARIREDGAIGYPYLGTVQVGGLSLEQAESRIRRELLTAKLLRNPQVTVAVEQYLSRQVTVLGEVKNPKRYGLSAPSTVLDMIAEAGGRLADGADYVILIRHENGQSKRHVLTMDRLIANATPVQVQANDIIVVPRMNVFYIEGAVQKAGEYRLDKDMTVMQAIAVGGGLSPRGSYSRIEIRRHNKDGHIQTLDAQLDNVLQPGDLLHVKERIF